MASPAKRAIIVGLDGASMELVLNMINWGHMPNLAQLIRRGVYRPMIGVFPTLTPPGWTAISTGSWPGTHQVMDFNIRKLGAGLDETLWGINTALSRSEYLWNTLERVGRKPIGAHRRLARLPRSKDRALPLRPGPDPGGCGDGQPVGRPGRRCRLCPAP